MRILGLDWGESRIGVAVSDLLGLTAQPVCVISEKDTVLQIEKIIAQASQLSAEKIVIGMPKNMNGSIGERGEKTQEFVALLSEKTDLPIIYWDERLTSVAAHRALAEGQVSGKKRKGIVDKIAAVFILQGYLDSIGGTM